MNEYYCIDEALQLGDVLSLMMSHVETTNICIEDYTTCGFSHAESLKPLWRSAVRSSSLSTISLSACVINLGPLVSGMVDILFGMERGINVLSGEGYGCGEVNKFSGLKAIEVLGNDAGTHPHEHRYGSCIHGSVNDLVPFLDYHFGLETLIVEGLLNIYRIEDYEGENYDEYVSDYGNFEPFYNYLPYIIAKPTFKTATLDKLQNSIEFSKEHNINFP